MQRPNTEFNFELAAYLADYAYYGLALREIAGLLGISKAAMRAVMTDLRYVRVIVAAKAQAKLELLRTQMGIALNENHEQCVKASQYLLASRFDIVMNRKELRLKLEEHKENLEHKRAVLEQWADYRSASLVNNASHQQIAEWRRDESPT